MHTDHLGSPRVLVDDAGNNTSSHHYIPFGDEKPLVGRLTSNNIKFTGPERDVANASFDFPHELDYMLARYYSSSLGRFMAVDPSSSSVSLGNPQSWNRYAYASNNPIVMVDPNGQDDDRSDKDKARLNDPEVRKAAQEAYAKSTAPADPSARKEHGFGTTQPTPGNYDTTGVKEGTLTNVDIPSTDAAGNPTEADVHVHHSSGPNERVKDPSDPTKKRELKAGHSEGAGGDIERTKASGRDSYVISKFGVERFAPSQGDTGPKMVLTGPEFNEYITPAKEPGKTPEKE